VPILKSRQKKGTTSYLNYEYTGYGVPADDPAKVKLINAIGRI
jgi:hypothetical protein